VIVENDRTGTPEKWGLGWDALAAAGIPLDETGIARAAARPDDKTERKISWWRRTARRGA